MEENNNEIDNNRRNRGGSSRKKKITLIIISILFIITSFGGYFIGMLAGEYNYVIQNFFTEINPNQNQTEFSKSGDPALTNKLEAGLPFSVLLVGLDYRESEHTRGRSDTLIVLTVNPTTEDVKMLSIPRDTLIELPGTEGPYETEGTYDKINSTYAYGGIPYLSETIESFFNIPIDFYATINFEGFANLIDAVGGITIDSDLEFSIKDETTGEMQYITEGVQHMNGKEALGYVRMRKEDPLGDWGRQQRQRQMLEALIDEILTFETVANYTDVLNVIAPNLTTNVSLDQGYIILNNYAQAASDIETLELSGESNTRFFPHFGFEVYTYEVYDTALAEIQDIFTNHLELEDYENNLDEDYDDLINGFPLYNDDATDELNL